MLAVSDGMYERHVCTDGKQQNTVPMVCTSIVSTDDKRQNAVPMVCTSVVCTDGEQEIKCRFYGMYKHHVYGQ